MAMGRNHKLRRSTTSIWADMVARPARYIQDVRCCAPVSFGLGNAAFSGATGVVGGFAIGALPAMAIQASVTALLVHQQAQATYHGCQYNVPMKTIALANWGSAATLLLGAVATGSAFAIAAASLPAVVFIVWGKGHWDLNSFVTRLERLQKEGREQGLTEQQIQESIQTDTLIISYRRSFQAEYGVADIGAVISAVAKGSNVKEITANMSMGLLAWESLIPMGLFGLGLARTFSQKAAATLDKHAPPFLKRVLGSSNALNSAGYAVTGTIVLGGACVGQHETVADLWNNITSSEIIQKLVAYTAWSHAYAVLDVPPSTALGAEAFQAWKDAFAEPKAVFALFSDAIANLSSGEQLARLDLLSADMLTLYKRVPEEFAKEKDQIFTILEVLAGRAPSGANNARIGIMGLCGSGDMRAAKKMGRMRCIEPQSGQREPEYPACDSMRRGYINDALLVVARLN